MLAWKPLAFFVLKDESKLFGRPVDEGVAEERALPVEGLPRISGVLHQENFLGDESCNIQKIGIGLLGLPLIERMLPVDVDHRPFRETFRPVFPVVVDTDRDPRFPEFYSMDDSQMKTGNGRRAPCVPVIEKSGVRSLKFDA